MKIEELHPGMRVFAVSRQRMGNTTLTSEVVHPVDIVSVDIGKGLVEARWNFNPPRKFTSTAWGKWKATRPKSKTAGTS